jgi:hypothetical protein
LYHKEPTAMLTITYANPADARRHDTANALMDLAERADALARELGAMLDGFPAPQEPGDAADTLWRASDDAVVTVYHLAYLIKAAARKIA